MTTRELTDAALSRRLITTAGKTPDASMSAALYGMIHSTSNPGLRRIHRPGEKRAIWGSVRWVLDKQPSSQASHS
jgi:hypothetical protein